MGICLKFKIGGLSIGLSNMNVHKIHEPEPSYQTFLTITPAHEFSSNSCDIHITFRSDPIPDTGKFRKIFDSNGSWVLLRDDDDLWIRLYSPNFSQPLRLLKLNKERTQGTLYCEKQLLDNRNENLVLWNPIRYPLDQLLLMYKLASLRGALHHAAGIVIDGNAYIFPGVSGAGKSTIMRQFVTDKAIMPLSDDRMVVRNIDETFYAYGTPWAGEAGIAVNAHAPLAGIFFITHGSSNSIKPLTPNNALERLLSVTSIPWYDRETMLMMLSYCEHIISDIPAYELIFKPDAEVVNVVRNFVLR